MTRLSFRFPAFKNLPEMIKMLKFSAWLQQSAPELTVPCLWITRKRNPPSPIRIAMYRPLVIQAFRPDRIIAAGASFVATVMGDDFVAAAEKENDFGVILKKKLKLPFQSYYARYPDSSCVASAVDSACDTGKWVILKNGHLAPHRHGWCN